MPENATTVEELQRRANALGPWRYDHEADGVQIKGMPEAAPIHGHVGRGREMMAHIISSVVGSRDPKSLRALDLGCLEGHYTELLAEARIGEIVAVEWSEEHVARASFLLNELRGFRNVTIRQGDVEDPRLLPSLGKFDVVILHGLLYHMRNPVALVERVADLARDEVEFALLLSTQFKFPFAEIADAMPLANIKVRKMQSRSDGSVKYQKEKSVYAPVAVRLNPAGVLAVLGAAGFKSILAYDTPTGAQYGFQLNLVALNQADPELVRRLQRVTGIPNFSFYPWDGRRLDGYNLNNIPGRLLSRAAHILRQISEKVGRSGARQSARSTIDSRG